MAPEGRVPEGEKVQNCFLRPKSGETNKDKLMNKQLISMTAVAAMAGAALAVESKNVVGFQENTANASGNTMMAPTFLTVGSETGCTLADLSVTGYTAPEWDDEEEEYTGGCPGGRFILNFLNSDGSNAARYYWIDNGETGPGWFFKADGTEISGGAASVPVPAGQGLWVLGRGMNLVIPSAL
jgi:hypothetical protein